MRSRKGQALIEALAGLGISIIFFVSCLKLWMNAVEDLKKESLFRQKQICELTGSLSCNTSEGGFVLVTMLMHLTVLIFSCQVLMAIYVTEEFKWKVSTWCFHNGIEAVLGSAGRPVTEVLELEKESNDVAAGLIQFKIFADGPQTTHDFAKGITESFYNITWKTHLKFSPVFFKSANFENDIKCGARKICHDEKCTYSLIADKS